MIFIKAKAWMTFPSYFLWKHFCNFLQFFPWDLGWFDSGWRNTVLLRVNSSKLWPWHLWQGTSGKTGISCYKSTKYIYTGLTNSPNSSDVWRGERILWVLERNDQSLQQMLMGQVYHPQRKLRPKLFSLGKLSEICICISFLQMKTIKIHW